MRKGLSGIGMEQLNALLASNLETVYSTTFADKPEHVQHQRNIQGGCVHMCTQTSAAAEPTASPETVRVDLR